MKSSKLAIGGYRPEIDGLRAVAVVLVLFFHAGFPSFSGGYLGVDIFFVISGFLITGIIVDELDEGHFSLWHFYERRVRRIVPALLLVIAASAVAAWIWLTPSEMIDFSNSVFATALFLSNIYFWDRSGYFGPEAEELPLLHTWSLAVEEQFYLFFPLFMLIAWRLGPRRLFWALAAIAAVSLATAEWGARHEPYASFYMSPTRAWELAAGALAALAMRQRSFGPNPPLAWIGLAAAIFPAFLYDEFTPFPSLYTLVPVGGTVLLLLFARPGTLVQRLLSLPLVVGIGLVSYSAYLWHYPLFAFARLTSVEEIGLASKWAIIAVTFVLAVASWRLVEQPFRKPGPAFMKHRNFAFVFGGLAMAVMLFAGWQGRVNMGWGSRVSQEQRDILAWRDYRSAEFYLTGTCMLHPDYPNDRFPPECIGDGKVVIWGDSHAAALASGWRLLDPGVAQLTASSCPPIPSFESGLRSDCPEIARQVLDLLEGHGDATVVLHANWSRSGRQDAFRRLPETIAALRKIGVENIVIVGGVPQYWPHLARRLVEDHVYLDGEHLVQAYLPEVRRVESQLREIAARQDVPFISLLDALCEGDRCIAVVPDGNGNFVPIAQDYGHSTHFGARYMTQLILDRM